jgi:6-phosphogluconate dehydrogenase (decarboxylating)
LNTDIRVLANRTHQQPMGDVVKESLDVKIDNPVVASASFTRYTNGFNR